MENIRICPVCKSGDMVQVWKKDMPIVNTGVPIELGVVSMITPTSPNGSYCSECGAMNIRNTGDVAPDKIAAPVYSIEWLRAKILGCFPSLQAEEEHSREWIGNLAEHLHKAMEEDSSAHH